MILQINTVYLHIVIVVYLIIEIFADSKYTEVVCTDNGPVQGEIRKNIRQSMKYSSFRGIRYGKSPTGYRRFKPPEEAEPWFDVFHAMSEATPCPQMDPISRLYIGDEDCLNLNIYTPVTDFYDISRKPLLPVMVWIHGGGFLHGWTNISYYGPDYLIEQGVVVVAINYRLGALGFLSLNHKNSSGNAGLKDQLLALKWINKNIAAFGGNPKHVTIFGHSAGAVSVDYHILSNASRGLFHQSISMSGSHLCKWGFSSTSEAESQAFNLGRQLGILNVQNKTKLLEALYITPARKLVKATDEIYMMDLPFKPTMENPLIAGDTAFITKCSIDKYKSGNFSKLPHLTGFMKDEAIFFALGDRMTSVKNIINNEMDMKNKQNESNTLFSNFRTFHANNMIGAAKSFLSGLSVAGFTSCIDAKKKLLTKYSNAPLYYYRISYTPEVSIHKQIHHINLDGAAHEDDIAYLWHVSILDYPKDRKSTFALTQQRMVQMWTNFAKYQRPVVPKGRMLLRSSWPISGVESNYLDINDELTVRNYPPEARNNVLSSILSNVFISPFPTQDSCGI